MIKKVTIDYEKTVKNLIGRKDAEAGFSIGNWAGRPAHSIKHRLEHGEYGEPDARFLDLMLEAL